MRDKRGNLHLCQSSGHQDQYQLSSIWDKIIKSRVPLAHAFWSGSYRRSFMLVVKAWVGFSLGRFVSSNLVQPFRKKLNVYILSRDVEHVKLYMYVS